jgi:hypothetical protein
MHRGTFHTEGLLFIHSTILLPCVSIPLNLSHIFLIFQLVLHAMDHQSAFQCEYGYLLL